MWPYGLIFWLPHAGIMNDEYTTERFRLELTRVQPSYFD